MIVSTIDSNRKHFFNIRKLVFVAATCILTGFAFFEAKAQPSYVFVRNNPQNDEGSSSVQVKWFCNELLNPEGFNLYRRQVGFNEWVKLNDLPITKRTGIAPTLLSRDDELEFFVSIVNESPQDLNEEFVFLNLLLKSFESIVLAEFLGIYFEDKSAIEGQSYQYRVTRIANSEERRLNQSRTLKVGAYEKLPEVKEVEIYQDKGVVEINWVQDEQQFYAVNIYSVNGSGQELKLNEEPIILSQVPDSTGQLVYPKPMYKAKGYKENEQFSFYLEGLDYFGETTKPSQLVQLVFDDITPPPFPSDLSGKADSMRVSLTWLYEGADDLKGFNIFRSTRSEGEFLQVNDGLIDLDQRSYAELIATAGPYYYVVEAIDHSNNIARSTPTFVEVPDVIPPLRPEGLTIKSDTGKFILNWKANTEPDLLGYYIYRTINGDNKGTYLLLNADPVDSNSWTQILPKSVKNDFYYYLVAVDTSFNRSPQSAYATAVLPDVTPPEKPFIESVNYSEEGITVQWTQNVESDLSGYHLYRSDSIQGYGKQINVNRLAAYSYRYTDRSADQNIIYYYSLEALDHIGNVSPSSEDAFAKWVVAKELNDQIDLKIRAKKRRQINRLEWTSINTDELKGYVVFRGQNERVVKPLTGVIKNTNTYSDKVEKDVDYFYQVRAYTTSGQVIYSPKVEQTIN